jgi:WD40 repeat protein
MWKGHQACGDDYYLRAVIHAFAVSPQNHLISASTGAVKVWSSADYSLCHILVRGALSLLLVGDRLLTAGEVDGEAVITMWDTHTWAQLRVLPCPGVEMDDHSLCSLTPIGRHVALAVDSDYTIALLNPRTWTVEHTLRDLDGIVTAFAVSNEGHLISGSRNDILKL